MMQELIAGLSEVEVNEVMRDFLQLEVCGHLKSGALLRKVSEALPGGDNVGNMTTVAFMVFKRAALYWVCNATSQPDWVALEVLEEMVNENV